MPKKLIADIKGKIEHFLTLSTTDKPFFFKKGVNAVRILYGLIRDMLDGQLSLRAMSLVYTTLITLVPLLAVSFSVLKGIGVQNQIEPLLKQMLAGFGTEQSTEIAETIIGFVDNIKVGVLGVIGFAILIYTVVALMQKIEASFNFIWRVGQGRSFARRFGDYLTVLFVGPLAIFLSASATTVARHSAFFQHFENLPGMGALVSGLFVLIPWLVLAMGFSALYIFMPNTRVKFYPAFVGGLFAALIWKFMGFVFATFVASSGNYIAIYAAFATLILFIIWLYIGWMVVLLGADIAFYVQKPRFVRISRKPLILSPYLTRAYGLAVAYHVGKAYHNRAQSWTTESLAATIDAPVLAIEQVLNALCDAKLVVASSDKDPEWFPGVSFATTPLKALTDALDHYGTSGHLGHTNPKLPVNVEDFMKRYNQSMEDEFLTQPIEKALGIL